MVQIVEATQVDFSIIQALAYSIWNKTYVEIISKEQIDYMLNKGYSINSLEDQYTAGHRFILLKKEEKYIGFASYEHHLEQKTKVHKLYLEPNEHGQGYGILMLDHIKDKALENKDIALFLNVNKYNKAKFFYEKYGFFVASETIIDIGNGFVMDDYIMEYVL
jgi:GNAT superfamily N-acetyltransferase